LRIAGHGISVDLPAGWEGRISRRQDAGPVLHIATFPLHVGDGDFGAAPTGRMRDGDVFAALLEFCDAERIRPGVGLYEATVRPVPRAEEFGEMQLQVTRRGQLGWQRFFTERRRTCCLYAVIQPGGRPPSTLVARLQGVLATLEVVVDAAGAA
jgi:hypothetical protein